MDRVVEIAISADNLGASIYEVLEVNNAENAFESHRSLLLSMVFEKKVTRDKERRRKKCELIFISLFCFNLID